MSDWVAAHPGYFYFWTGFWVAFVVVEILIVCAAAVFVRGQVTRIVDALLDVNDELRRTW